MFERVVLLVALAAGSVLVVLWFLAAVRILWFAIVAPGEFLRLLREFRRSPGSPWRGYRLPRR